MSNPDDATAYLKEIAIGVRFDALPNMNSFAISKIYPKFEDRFPESMEANAAVFPIENETHPSIYPGHGVNPASMQVLSRYIFINEDTGYLIQIQADQFICNWRADNSGKRPCPGFDKTLSVFTDEFKCFQDAIVKKNTTRQRQIEVSHVYIFPERDDSGVDFLNKINPMLAWPKQLSSNESMLEFCSDQATYILHLPNTTRFVGRMFVSIKPIFIAVSEVQNAFIKFFLLEITSKILPDGFSEDNPLTAATQFGHDYNNKAFNLMVTL